MVRLFPETASMVRMPGAAPIGSPQFAESGAESPLQLYILHIYIYDICIYVYMYIHIFTYTYTYMYEGPLGHIMSLLDLVVLIKS